MDAQHSLIESYPCIAIVRPDEVVMAEGDGADEDVSEEEAEDEHHDDFAWKPRGFYNFENHVVYWTSENHVDN